MQSSAALSAEGTREAGAMTDIPLVRVSPSEFREIEERISLLPFRGIPLGATLNNAMVICLLDGNGDWRRRMRWKNRLRMLKALLDTRAESRALQPASHTGRILITWTSAESRFSGLVGPVLAELDTQACAVIYEDWEVRSLVPPGVTAVEWDEAVRPNVSEWRAAYLAVKPAWDREIRRIRTDYGLPAGVEELLSVSLMAGSKRVMGCLRYLKENRPAAILTEYDRNYLWSCLILAARHLGIPTVTLVHGVMNRDALGFAPVLADTVVCWGALDRAILLAAGEHPGRIVIGGCPRLTRELTATPEGGRARLGLRVDRPVAMLATSPDLLRFDVAEAFCAAVRAVDGLTGAVRLHPSERLATYSAVSARYPEICFSESSASTLDETLAAADIVVVRSSGVGSDALVKRRPVVVVNPEAELRGHDADLVAQAGCPHARTAEELASILRRMLSDQEFREAGEAAAERFVEQFCGAFGQESARRIAAAVMEAAERSRSS